jgi:hypothetical protein
VFLVESAARVMPIMNGTMNIQTKVDDVWVCSWASVRPLASALRVGLIEVAKSRLAAQAQHDKMEMVFSYLSSQEFGNRVAGVVEAFMSMRQDLETEKWSMQRIWSRREKQLDRASMNTAGMYGDLQGIIGASLPVIEGLAIPVSKLLMTCGRKIR